MDKSVIKKVIKHCDATDCPSFKYENPLLDKNISDLLAKKFIKLLKNQKSSNEKKRLLILENIRKSCNVKPPNHMYIDDNLSEVLRNTYEELPDIYSIDKDLDTFFIRNLKEKNIRSLHSPSYTPDIVQALCNLNKEKKKINDIVVKDIIYWNVDSEDSGYLEILNTIWNVEFMKGFPDLPDDISIKIKPKIENIILLCAFEMMNTVILEEDDWFSENEELMQLVEMCCVSRECFQISCSIMNSIFIKTKFDEQMSLFINLFIKFVNIKIENICRLYSTHLQHIVLLLDINLHDFTEEVEKIYISLTLKHLNTLHKECESDLIMLLSHFNKWIDPFYNNKMK